MSDLAPDYLIIIIKTIHTIGTSLGILVLSLFCNPSSWDPLCFVNIRIVVGDSGLPGLTGSNLGQLDDQDFIKGTELVNENS